MNGIQGYADHPQVTASYGRLSKPALVLVMCLLGTSYMFNAMDRQVFPSLLTAIRGTYGLSLAQAGFVSTVFTINVAAFGALGGWFYARFTRKSILVGGLIAYSVFTLITPLAQGFVTLAAYRALTGVGEALQVGALYCCLGGYFARSRGAAMGCMQAFFGLGALMGPIIGTRLHQSFGQWEMPFYVFGVAGIVVAVLLSRFMPPAFSEAVEQMDEMESFDSAAARASKLLNRNVCLGALSFSLVGLSFFSYTALYATYLHERLGFTSVAAGSALGMYGLGAIGAVVGGWAGDRLGKAGIFACLLVLAAVSYLMFHGTAQPLVHGILSLLFGLMVSGYFYARFVSVIQRSAPPQKIGYAVAAAMTGFYLSGPFAGFLFGELVEIWGWSTAANIMVVAPPCVAIVLMCFFDFSRLRKA
ncbi:transporter [Caballeronia sordidicola]|uniref:Transporter n=1 Tax=Caballeronia sordidicola TaxID=196367 RepID=A0A158GVU5_CABSO|nr:MFS transporter [Caballeronia sordidicola]SAL36198.1 transporter [Caballeronia sordidicola]